MNRSAFIRAVRKYAKANDLAFEWDARVGKGGHGRVTVGAIHDGPDGPHPGRIESILKQLGLPEDEV